MIGAAVNAGLKRAAPEKPPILDRTNPFALSDLVNLRLCLLPLAALRDAFQKCVAHTVGLNGGLDYQAARQR